MTQTDKYKVAKDDKDWEAKREMTKVQDSKTKDFWDEEIIRCDCSDGHYGQMYQLTAKGDEDYGYVSISMTKEPRGNLWQRLKDAWKFIIRSDGYLAASVALQADGLKEFQNALNRYVERVENKNEST